MGGLVESFKVADSLASQRIVSFLTATAQTVGYTKNLTSTVAMVGISIDETQKTATAAPIQINGIAKLLFNDSVSAGALVTADTSGRGIAFTAVTAATWSIGALVGPSVNDTGTVAEVLISPQLNSSE